jgi:hypothetical protein
MTPLRVRARRPWLRIYSLLGRPDFNIKVVR